MSLRLVLLALALIGSLGCQDKGTGSLVPDAGNGFPAASEVPGIPDDVAELFREGAGLVQGDITVRGTAETNPDWDDHPFPVSQAARSGDLAVFRVRGRLTNNANTTLFCKLSQTTKNYPSYFIPGTNTDTYRAIYVENSEPMNLTFYNSSNWNTAQNSKAAIYNYSFKTSAVENADEPNDDDNGATISDRTLAKNIPRDFMATRSVYYFDQSKRDIEEWYRTEVPAGTRFNWKFATTPGRYGSTWSYELRVFDPAGVQMGDTVHVGTTEGAQGIFRTATTSGPHYLQIVATPVSKSYTNLFYALYTVTPCFFPIVNQVAPDSESNFCPGGTVTLIPSIQYGATSYWWDFGGGAIPNSSTAAQPTVQMGAPGVYNLRLLVINACGASTEYSVFYLVSCSGGVGQQGGSGATVIPTALRGFGDGGAIQLGYFAGTVDLDPSPGVRSRSAAGQAGFLGYVNSEGEMQIDRIITGGAGTSVSPRAVDYQPSAGYRIAGNYFGTVDFDPGAGVVQRTSSTDGGNFVLALDPGFSFSWVATFGSGDSSIDLVFHPASESVIVGGAYSGTVDLDPGLGVLSRTAAGTSDAYLLMLSREGLLVNLATWGGTGLDQVRTISAAGSTLQAAGVFSGVTDFDPGPGAASLTALGSFAGFFSSFAIGDPGQLAYTRVRGFMGADATVSPTDIAVVPVGVQSFSTMIVGEFSGTPDFDPGGGTQTRTAQGAQDAFVLHLDSISNFGWVRQIGGSGTDSARSVALNAAGNELRVAGYWNSSVDFDPGPGTDIRTAVGGSDAFLVAFTTFDTWRWSSTWSGTGIEQATQVVIDDLGISRVTGTFTGLTDFDPSPLTSLELAPLGESDTSFSRILSNGRFEQ